MQNCNILAAKVGYSLLERILGYSHKLPILLVKDDVKEYVYGVSYCVQILVYEIYFTKKQEER